MSDYEPWEIERINSQRIDELKRRNRVLAEALKYAMPFVVLYAPDSIYRRAKKALRNQEKPL